MLQARSYGGMEVNREGVCKVIISNMGVEILICRIGIWHKKLLAFRAF